MNENDLGCTYEWESEFNEWLKNKKNTHSSQSKDIEVYPEIKMLYSENFVIQMLMDEKIVE